MASLIKALVSAEIYFPVLASLILTKDSSECLYFNEKPVNLSILYSGFRVSK